MQTDLDQTPATCSRLLLAFSVNFEMTTDRLLKTGCAQSRKVLEFEVVFDKSLIFIRLNKGLKKHLNCFQYFKNFEQVLEFREKSTKTAKTEKENPSFCIAK